MPIISLAVHLKCIYFHGVVWLRMIAKRRILRGMNVKMLAVKEMIQTILEMERMFKIIIC